MNKYKNYFPIFESNPNLVYLDSGATSLKPQLVLDKTNEYYSQYCANIHRGLYPMAEKASEEYEAVREKVAKFIKANDLSEVVFTSGTTAGLNMVARGWGDRNVSVGDEIVMTEMEHHSNLVPWQELAKRTGAKLRFIKFDNNYQLDLSNLEELINKRTKLLALTQVSNVLGTVNPIAEIAKQCRIINPNICIVVDGAQAVAHLPVNVIDLGVDFYAFSGHKMYGPTGVGVLWIKKERIEETEPVNFGGGMIAEVDLDKATLAPSPQKYEGGTPPIGEVIGLGAAIDFINEVGMQNITNQEKKVMDLARDELKKLPWVKTYDGGGSTLAFMIDGIHAHDVAEILGNNGVAVRAGHHCAMPLHDKLGVAATARISLGIYNQIEDVERLVIALNKVWTTFTGK